MIQMTAFRILAAALLLMNAFDVSAEEHKAGIEIGIAPFLSIQTLVQNYAPMRAYLQSRLNEPVTFVSAPDYKTYTKRIKNHEYPIIIATANSAYLAWAQFSYIPLLQPLIYTHPVVIIAKNQKLNKLSDLRGKTVAMPDALAVVAMQGLQMLREAGLEPERDVSVKNMQNHSVAVNLVITGEVAAAIVSDRAVMQMPPSVREKIKIVQRWEKGAAPGVVYLCSPDMPRERAEQLNLAILEYSRDVPEGIELMKRLGYDGLAPITAEELRAFAPYGAMLKEVVSKPP